MFFYPPPSPIWHLRIWGQGSEVTFSEHQRGDASGCLEHRPVPYDIQLLSFVLIICLSCQWFHFMDGAPEAQKEEAPFPGSQSETVVQPHLDPKGGSDPQSTPHEAETPPAPARGPYLGVEHLVQRGAAAHQPVHQRQPQAQRAVIDGLHEDDLRQDQQRVPHVAAKLARHAGPRGPAATRGLGQRRRAMGPGPPWHLRGHTPDLSQPAITMATPPRPGVGTGTEGASPFREWEWG